jgi:hypothetical protein
MCASALACIESWGVKQNVNVQASDHIRQCLHGRHVGMHAHVAHVRLTTSVTSNILGNINKERPLHVEDLTDRSIYQSSTPISSSMYMPQLSKA